MALKATLKSLEEVDEALRGFYTQGSDGLFRLDVEGGFKTTEEVEGLSSALGKERTARAEAEKKLKAFDGIEDPDKARDALRTVENLDADKRKNAEEMERQFEARLAPIKKQLEDAEAERSRLSSELYEERVTGFFLRSTFVGEKLAIPPRAAAAMYGKHFKLEDGKVVAYDAAGNVIYGDDGKPADPEQAIQRLINADPDRDRLLKGAPGGSGSPADRGGEGGIANPWKRETFNLTEQGRILKSDPAKAKRLAAEAGVKLPS